LLPKTNTYCAKAGGAAKKQLAENSKRLKWIAAAIAAADVRAGDDDG